MLIYRKLNAYSIVFVPSILNNTYNILMWEFGNIKLELGKKKSFELENLKEYGDKPVAVNDNAAGHLMGLDNEEVSHRNNHPIFI